MLPYLSVEMALNNILAFLCTEKDVTLLSLVEIFTLIFAIELVNLSALFSLTNSQDVTKNTDSV